VCSLGEVAEPALPDWDDFDKLNIPDIHDPGRWTQLDKQRAEAGESVNAK